MGVGPDEAAEMVEGAALEVGSCSFGCKIRASSHDDAFITKDSAWI